MWAALEVAKREGPGKRIVVILPDSVRNYMTKFMDDQWMKEHGFTERGWEADTIASLLKKMPRREMVTACAKETLSDAVMKMKEFGVSQLPVLDEDRLVGIVTESDLLGKLVGGNASLTSAVAEVMFRNVNTVRTDSDASDLLPIFGRGEIGVVVDEGGKLVSVITKIDLVEQLTGTPG